MKNFFLFLSLVLSATSFAQSTGACDFKKLEDEWDAEYAKLKATMEAQLAKDEAATVDMSAYLNVSNQYRACQKAADPKSVTPCNAFSIWANKTLSPNFKMERFFEVMQNRKGTCSQDTATFQHIIKNAKGLQILYHRDGSYVMTHVIPGKAVGIPTGRTFLFKDGKRTKDSTVFVIDFPEPLDKYDISLFWGLNIDVGSGTEELAYTLQGTNITFEWSNGAFVTIDSLSEDIIDSNFLDPISYKELCATDQDVAPNGKKRFFPRVKLLPGADKLVSDPKLIQ